MSVFLPLDGLSLRTRLLILLLAREAELALDQVDSPHARAAGAARTHRRRAGRRTVLSGPAPVGDGPALDVPKPGGRLTDAVPGYQPSAVHASDPSESGAASAARWRPCCRPR